MQSSSAVRSMRERLGSVPGVVKAGADAEWQDVWELVYDPIEPLEEIVERVFSSKSARRVSRKSRTRLRGWGHDVEGRQVFYGKHCCADTVMRAETRRVVDRVLLVRPDLAADAIVCGACQQEVSAIGEACECGVGTGRFNTEVQCRGCMAVYRHTRRISTYVR